MVLTLVFVLFPPWPPRIIRKVMFRAPPRGHYYHLIYGQGDERRIAFSAREAAERPDVRLCLPMLLEKKVDAADVYYHLLRSKPVILQVEGDVYICAVLLRCELSRLRLPEDGRSPYLLIFCQPNSSDLGSCLLMEPNFADIADFLRCDMLFFDYPGYGVSDGQPSEYLIYRSAECVFEHAKQLGYEENNIILIGFSLGTAAAVHLASIAPQLAALVLMAPFTSFLRVGFNCPSLARSPRFDLFRSIDKAAAIKCPTLVCHGTKDVMVKVKHGETIAAEIDGAEMFFVDKATHQGLLGQRKMWDKIDKYLEETLKIGEKWKALVENGAKKTQEEQQKKTMEAMKKEDSSSQKKKQKDEKGKAESVVARSVERSAESVAKSVEKKGSAESVAKSVEKENQEVNPKRSAEETVEKDKGAKTPASSETLRSPTVQPT